MLDSALVVWFILTGFSVAYVAWDAWLRNPELSVMKWGWVLVTLYAGPVAAALYPVLFTRTVDLGWRA